MGAIGFIGAQQPNLTQPAEMNLHKENQLKSKAVISLQHVVKEYRTAAGSFRALKGITMDVTQGELLGIIGKSGAGKTTLINMISGIDSLTQGDLRVGDVAVNELDENKLALWRGQNLGVIYQSFQLMPTLSLLDNVLLPMDFCGTYRRRESISRGLMLLDEVGLGDHVNKLPSAISGGQQQRVAIARALANDPPILLADEPTGRLDSVTANVIFEIFEDLARHGKTIVMVTHDHTLMRRMTRVVELVDGLIR
jgi:putative ABC transport system ATP-binding protein